MCPCYSHVAAARPFVFLYKRLISFNPHVVDSVLMQRIRVQNVSWHMPANKIIEHDDAVFNQYCEIHWMGRNACPQQNTIRKKNKSNKAKTNNVMRLWRENPISKFLNQKITVSKIQEERKKNV